jgi:hypothetical protein
MIRPLLFLLLLAGLSSCKKEESPFSEVPRIEVRSIYPDSVKAFTDSIVVEIYYEDGDGDLGENSPFTQNLFLVDQRNQLQFGFRIGRIAAEGTPAIRGTMKVVLPYTNLVNNAGPEQLFYKVRVVDRDGNTSNTENTGSIVVVE